MWSIEDTLGAAVLSLIERLRARRESVLYWVVSFIQRFLYRRFHCCNFIHIQMSYPKNSIALFLQLGQDKTTVYLLNGFLLVFVFFVVRILNIPFALLVYAAQYHNWDIMKAVFHLRLACYVFIILQYIMQFYWFVLIVKLALQSLAKIMQKPDTQREVDKKKTG